MLEANRVFFELVAGGRDGCHASVEIGSFAAHSSFFFSFLQ